MRFRLGILVLGLVLGFVPATADPYTVYYADQTTAVELNTYSPQGVRAQEAPEVSMIVAKTIVVANSDPSTEPPEPGGCIDILAVPLLDSGCGPLTVTRDPVLNTTHVVGDISSTAYDYVIDPFSITERGPSVIHVDLMFTGMGDLQTSTDVPILVGVCGLPPDTRGAFVIASDYVLQTATPAGSLISDTIGPIDVTPLTPAMTDSVGFFGGACAM